MTNKKFESAARNRRNTALYVALLFHLALFAAVAYYSKMDILPDFAKELIGNKEQPRP